MEKDSANFIVALMAHLFEVANITEMRMKKGMSKDHQMIILTEFERLLIQPFKQYFLVGFK